MKKISVIMATFLIGGCIEQPMYLVHKTGSTLEQRRAAVDECEFQAISAVPRAMSTQISGGYYSPGSVQCSTIGTFTTCNQVGGINIPASASTYDANQELRDRYVNRCLRQSGFEVFQRPVCRSEADKAFVRSTSNNQPMASDIPCVIR